MLVLSRQINQSIYIDGDIEIRVLPPDKRTGETRLGIIAPRSVRVHRRPEDYRPPVPVDVDNDESLSIMMESRHGN